MRALRPLLVIPLLVAAVFMAAPSPASAAVSVGISVGVAPPPLPVYDQPPIPGPGYVWIPGYWAWGPDGYYWVPGTWVLPPAVGLYWTPPWWGWSNGVYVFNAGYWGPTVGFYGGIDYGFGYFGHGYDGGYWNHGRFFYNREVNNIRNVNITNIYDRRVRDSVRTQNRVSFNGGTGGISARPNAQERAVMSQRHVGPTALQRQNIAAARSNRALWASSNHGQPTVTATSRAGRFNATSVQGGNAAGVQHGNNASLRHGNNATVRRGTPPSVQRGNTTTSVQHGPSANTRTRNFATTGRPLGTTGTAHTNLRGPHQNTTVATPRAGVQTTPRFTQHQPTRSFSHASPGRFGAGRNAFVQHAPRPSVPRSAPAHFGAAPAMHAPARSFSGGGPRGGGHPARVAPQKEHR